MSEEDLLGKVDALLRRHQPAPAAASEIPTLSQVVGTEKVDIPPVPVLTEIVQTAPEIHPEAVPEPSVSPEPADLQPAAPEVEPDEDLEQINAELEQIIAPLLKNWLESALPGKLDQLKPLLRQMVRECVAEELQKQMDRLEQDFARKA
jgi:hypothetical protein